MRLEGVEHPLGAVAVADVAGDKAGAARLAEDRDRPFGRDEGLVVRRHHHRRMVPLRQRGQLRGGDGAGRRDRLGVADRLRRDPVLAVGAVQVAPEHSERQGVGPRKGVEERLFLDRIDLQRADVAPRHAQHPVVVEADLADADAAARDEAVMAARVAAHRPTREGIAERPLAGQTREGLRQGGHGCGVHRVLPV